MRTEIWHSLTYLKVCLSPQFFFQEGDSDYSEKLHYLINIIFTGALILLNIFTGALILLNIFTGATYIELAVN